MACFIPHDTEVFVPCHLESDDGGAEIVVQELAGCDRGKKHTVKREEAVMMDRDEMEALTGHPPSDLIHLSHVTEPSLLYILKKRFAEDEIYTSAGSVLIAVNPFKMIEGLYDEKTIRSYHNGSRNLSNSPHIFAIAHNAMQGIAQGENQSMIVSGESGAGKTETTKHCLTYLTNVAGSKTGAHIKLLQASPILEAWGNAKTLRNNNSSRFGKYTEMYLDPMDNSIVGASIDTYLLEKTRIVSQDHNERNYHAFYQLLRGADPHLLEKLHLTSYASSPEKLFYLGQSGCVEVENVDDGKDFKEVLDALEVLGFTEEETMTLQQILAGVLLIGNIGIKEDPNDAEKCSLQDNANDTTSELGCVADLLGVDSSLFRQAITMKSIQRGGSARIKSIAYRPYTVREAIDVRDALAKELYKRAFHALVLRIDYLVDCGDKNITDDDVAAAGYVPLGCLCCHCCLSSLSLLSLYPLII